MYITKPGHVYNANTGNAANGITPTTSGGVKPSLFWFFILDIPELRNIESSIDKSRDIDGNDTSIITRQNRCFAKLYNDVPTIYNGSNALNQYAQYSNTFEKNHNIGLKISLAVSTIFILFYFIYPSPLIEIIEKINII